MGHELVQQSESGRCITDDPMMTCNVTVGLGCIWQGLLSQGARRIAVVGLPPMGCLPFIISSNAFPIAGRQCVEKLSSVAREYNALLQSELAHLPSSEASQGAKIYYADIYGPLEDMIQNHQKYGKSARVLTTGTPYFPASHLPK